MSYYKMPAINTGMSGLGFFAAVLMAASVKKKNEQRRDAAINAFNKTYNQAINFLNDTKNRFNALRAEFLLETANDLHAQGDKFKAQQKAAVGQRSKTTDKYDLEIINHKINRLGALVSKYHAAGDEAELNARRRRKAEADAAAAKLAAEKAKLEAALLSAQEQAKLKEQAARSAQEAEQARAERAQAEALAVAAAKEIQRREQEAARAKQLAQEQEIASAAAKRAKKEKLKKTAILGAAGVVAYLALN